MCPWTMILVPSGSEFLFQPFRSRTDGDPPSTDQCWTWPSAPLTSRYSQECGFTQSILTTVPSSVTGLLASNSAEKEWWAKTGNAAARVPASIVMSFVFMVLLLVVFQIVIQKF